MNFNYLLEHKAADYTCSILINKPQKQIEGKNPIFQFMCMTYYFTFF